MMTAPFIASVSPDVLIACHNTAAFTIVYMTALLFQVFTKQYLIQQAKKNNTRFDRYTSVAMRSPDRLVANLIEWSFVFLPLLWTLAMTDKLSSESSVVVMAAWTYVALRALYVVLVARHGVSDTGRNKALWISTYPAYVCLAVMLVKAAPILYD